MRIIRKKAKCKICGAPAKYRKLRLCIKHYLKYRSKASLAAGLCIRCWKHPVIPGLAICEECSKSSKVRVRARRLKLISDHHCRDCGAVIPAERHATRCVKCQSLTKKRRDLYRSQQRCLSCGEPLVSSHFTRCEHCRGAKSHNKRIHASLNSGNAGFDIDLRSGVQRVNVNDFLKHPEKYRPTVKKCSCGDHITTPEFAALGVCQKCYYKQSTAKPMDHHTRKANRKFSAS